MPYIDFADLKARVRIEQVAEMLQLDLTPSGNQLRGECPGCREGGARTLAITPAKGVFFCFSAKAGGDCIELAAHAKGIAQREAAELIARHFLTPPGREPQRPSPRPEPEPGLAPLAYLEADHPAVEAVGFDPETAKALGIGYAGKGMMRGTVAIPVRLEDGTLAGYLGITEAKLPPRFHLTPKVVPFQKKTA